METKVYFGENGLTSTSANYIASKAGNYIASKINKINNIKMTEKYIEIVGDSKKHLLHESANIYRLNEVDNLIDRITEAYALEAWLREAIKAKQRLVEEVNNLTFEDYLKLKGEPIKEKPVKKNSLTKEDVVAEWSVKEQARYYYLQTLVSTIAKTVLNGQLTAERNEYYKRLEEPTVINGSGRDTIIAYYKCILKEEDVDNVFMRLHEKHRNAQAELNGMLHAVETKVQESENEVQREYVNELELYRVWLNKVLENMELFKRDALADIQQLKIIIPNSLRNIYEIVNKAGK